MLSAVGISVECAASDGNVLTPKDFRLTETYVNGFKAYDLDGGILKWMKEDMPIVK